MHTHSVTVNVTWFYDSRNPAMNYHLYVGYFLESSTHLLSTLKGFDLINDESDLLEINKHHITMILESQRDEKIIILYNQTEYHKV